jgi:hypothetical protein
MTCMMNYEIATHLSGARNDTLSLYCADLLPLSLRGTTVPKQSRQMTAGLPRVVYPERK